MDPIKEETDPKKVETGQQNENLKLFENRKRTQKMRNLIQKKGKPINRLRR